MKDKRKKILIVEDDISLQQALMEFLEMEKFSTLTAADGEEGVEVAKSGLPDLILLDIILPKKDGHQVLRELKDDEKTKNIPIILLTNLGSLSDIEKALALGATTYLVKGDYQLKEIVGKVKETLKMQ